MNLFLVMNALCAILLIASIEAVQVEKVVKPKKAVIVKEKRESPLLSGSSSASYLPPNKSYLPPGNTYLPPISLSGSGAGHHLSHGSFGHSSGIAGGRGSPPVETYIIQHVNGGGGGGSGSSGKGGYLSSGFGRSRYAGASFGGGSQRYKIQSYVVPSKSYNVGSFGGSVGHSSGGGGGGGLSFGGAGSSSLGHFGGSHSFGNGAGYSYNQGGRFGGHGIGSIGANNGGSSLHGYSSFGGNHGSGLHSSVLGALGGQTLSYPGLSSSGAGQGLQTSYSGGGNHELSFGGGSYASSSQHGAGGIQSTYGVPSVSGGGHGLSYQNYDLYSGGSLAGSSHGGGYEESQISLGGGSASGSSQQTLEIPSGSYGTPLGAPLSSYTPNYSSAAAATTLAAASPVSFGHHSSNNNNGNSAISSASNSFGYQAPIYAAGHKGLRHYQSGEQQQQQQQQQHSIIQSRPIALTGGGNLGNNNNGLHTSISASSSSLHQAPFRPSVFLGSTHETLSSAGHSGLGSSASSAYLSNLGQNYGTPQQYSQLSNQQDYNGGLQHIPEYTQQPQIYRIEHQPQQQQSQEYSTIPGQEYRGSVDLAYENQSGYDNGGATSLEYSNNNGANHGEQLEHYSNNINSGSNSYLPPLQSSPSNTYLPAATSGSGSTTLPHNSYLPSHNYDVRSYNSNIAGGNDHH